jgi:hypothetical protein
MAQRPCVKSSPKKSRKNDAVPNHLDRSGCLPADLVVVSPLPQAIKPVPSGACPAEAYLTGCHFAPPQKNAKNVHFTKENSCTVSVVMILKDCVLVEARQI